MPVTYQVERYSHIVPELARLYPEHYEEVAEYKEKIDLSPDWDRYLDLCRSGVLFLATVRDEGDLVGYFMGMIQPHLHYRHSKTAYTDIYFLKKDYRHGGVGKKLFEFVIDEMKERGVQRFYIGCKVSHDVGPLFERLGFKEIERHYSMYLGD